MGKSINVIKKSRGRPATGQGTLVGVRLQPDQLDDLDGWTKKHAPDLSRPEAIRRLVELGLGAPIPTGRARRSGRPLDLGQMSKLTPALAKKAARSSRAAELAGKAIDGIIDPSAPPDGRAQRRRRLTKGPPEFREERVDLPKAKGK
jgi:hypothetical protein